MTRSAATILTLLMIFTGPLLTPGKLLRVLCPFDKVKGLPGISTPPIRMCTDAVDVLTFANLSWLSRSTLLYQGSQYVVLSWLSGSAIISEKLVGTPFTLKMTRCDPN